MLRRQKIEDLDFDNVPFVLNCVDVLAGDESFVSLRKKRPKHRTLVELEAQTNIFNEELQAEAKKAENEAADELQAAQKAFDKEVEQVQAAGRTGTSGPRKSSSPTSRRSPSGGSTSRSISSRTRRRTRSARARPNRNGKSGGSRTMSDSLPSRFRHCRRSSWVWPSGLRGEGEKTWEPLPPDWHESIRDVRYFP